MESQRATEGVTTGPGSERLQHAGGTISGPAAAGVEKIIVAVHGVGDQHSFATIQAVVNQFCAFYNHPAGIPLGQFHTGRNTFSLEAPYPQNVFGRYAFAEVYWAKYPREVVADKYMLEESKAWAQTIVERLRLRWRTRGDHAQCHDRDFRLVKQILSEMIETIAVLDRICFLAEKAGLFTFDLRKLLDDYLGDVQIVTEFGSDRKKILAAFDALLADAHSTYPGAKIYLVAHSQGTVVAFLGLLNAFRATTPPAWANSVRGMMTLGSPIDKHLVLWPELFGKETAPAHLPDNPIEWHNYYDEGDPIGFALDDARAWVKIHGWERVFNFPVSHDHGFTRYPFPGKAHVDYWKDEAVFGHFITKVLEEERTPVEGETLPDFSQPPSDHRLNKWLSYVLPYTGIAAITLVAVYILFKAVVQAIDPTGPLATSNRAIVSDVLRNTLIILGITVAARLPRLSRNIGLRMTGIAAGAFACLVYWLTAGNVSTEFAGVHLPPGVPTVALATMAIGLSYVFGAFFPSWGVIPLLMGGAIAVIGKVIFHLDDEHLGPIWPVFLATAAFLYLWWLAALIFDLTVIWHWYIRNSRILHRMDEIMGGTRGAAPSSAAAGATYAPQVQR
jgi:hypothetical protein